MQNRKWGRLGDFSVKEKVYYNDREVTYYHAADSIPLIGRLIIYGFRDDSISIRYYEPAAELFDECMNKRKGYDNGINNSDKTSKWNVGIEKSSDKNKLREFIELIDEYDSLIEIKNEIFDYVGIDRSVVPTVTKVGMFSQIGAAPAPENNSLALAKRP